MEMLFVLETAGPVNRGVDRFLPNTPIRIVVDHLGADVTTQYPAAELDARLWAGEIDEWIDNETFVEALLPQMLSRGTQYAESKAAEEIQQGMRRMLATMDHEINRLKALAAINNHIRPEEIEFAEQERAAVRNRISDARIRLDAMQLVQRGAFGIED